MISRPRWTSGHGFFHTGKNDTLLISEETNEMIEKVYKAYNNSYALKYSSNMQKRKKKSCRKYTLSTNMYIYIYIYLKKNCYSLIKKKKKIVF